MSLTRLKLKNGLTNQEIITLLGGGGLFTPGSVFYVDSVTGSDGNLGTDPSAPKGTIDGAINACTANKGDVIIVFPKHTETVASASAITADIAGVSIIGLGEGADVPTLTFSATDSTFVISAASVVVKNIMAIPSIDSVVSPFVVSGADCTLDVIIKDASDTVEFVRGVLTTAAADRLNLRMKYLGRTGGDACVNAVRLVGADTADLDIDFYGKASTAVVEFHTTACTDVNVAGDFYVSGTTDLSKNVVDTATGSTWSVVGFDSAAGQNFSGGSAAAVASDDVSTINATIGTVNSTTTDNINGKIGTDTEMADNSLYDLIGADAKTDSLSSALYGASGIATYPAAAEAANGVSMAEVLRNISDLQASRTVLKSSGDLTAFGTSLTLFTVTGDVMAQVFASVDVAVTSTSGTTTLEVGVAGNTAALCVQDAVDGTAFAIGDSWSLATAADANAAAIDTGWTIIGNGVDIILTGSVDDITAGDIDFYCRYTPLTAGSSVVAA